MVAVGLTAALLRDGRTVGIRPIVATDVPALMEFHARLDPRTVYLRFFGIHPVLAEHEATHFCCVDYQARYALVAELDGTLIGVTRYALAPGTSSAEVAFVVADAYQGQGLGTLLLEHLALAARQRGITTFTAETLASNGPMQEVFRQTGFVSTSHMSMGVADVHFAITPTQRYLDAVIERDWGTTRPVAVSHRGGVGVLASTPALRELVLAALDPLDVSVVVEETADCDLTEALAAVMGSGACRAVIIAHAGPEQRPRTLISRLRAAARRLPVVAMGLDRALADQAGVELITEVGQLPAGLGSELMASGKLSDCSGCDPMRSHVLLGLQLPGRLTGEVTRELFACYGVGPFDTDVTVVVSDQGLHLESGLGVQLGVRRLLPLTDLDVSALTADAVLADVIIRLARLVDDQPELRRVEWGAAGNTVWLAEARSNDDDPFLRCLPVHH